MIVKKIKILFTFCSKDDQHWYNLANINKLVRTYKVN